MNQKKLSFAALCLTIALLLTACGNGTAESTAEPIAPVNPSGAEQAQESATLEEIVFLTKDHYSSPEFGQMLEEQFLNATGVPLHIKHVPSNNWEEKITASFISGDMPDISRVAPNFYSLVRQDFVQPLGEYIKGNPTMKELLENNPGAVEPFQYFEDIYGISTNNQKYMSIWMRGDWIEQLGKSSPTSLDEFTELLTALRDGDPDGNGKSDTIPLTLSADIKNYDTIAAAFGVRSELFVKDGAIYNPFPTAEYKEFMDYMKMLYAEGLIDKETPTNTSYGSVRSKFHTGEAAGIVMWDDIYDNLANGLEKAGFDGKVIPLDPFETENGAFGYSYYTADAPLVITTACKNPSEVFDVFFTWYFTDPDAIVSTSQGIEGYSFDIVDGVEVPNPDNNGVGYHGQSFPPVMLDFEYPFEFFKVNKIEYEFIREIAKKGDAMGERISTTPPGPSYDAYYNIKSNLDTQIKDLFFNYMMGNIDYDAYLSGYQSYADEIGLDTMFD